MCLFEELKEPEASKDNQKSYYSSEFRLPMRSSRGTGIIVGLWKSGIVKSEYWALSSCSGFLGVLESSNLGMHKRTHDKVMAEVGYKKAGVSKKVEYSNKVGYPIGEISNTRRQPHRGRWLKLKQLS